MVFSDMCQKPDCGSHKQIVIENNSFKHLNSPLIIPDKGIIEKSDNLRETNKQFDEDDQSNSHNS